ncbi:hypothetical protein R1sor_017325 [Riccia sorocarpa]|uniref:Ribosomal protein S1 n=1 Tax=Riccia sorocarpa TaxID=122646 RepID=A0ABD3I6H1_9MARC
MAFTAAKYIPLAVVSPGGNNVLSEAEERWQRVVDGPLEGVPFTYENFENALTKYDFNFEIGDLVKGVVLKTDNNGALIGAKARHIYPFQKPLFTK